VADGVDFNNFSPFCRNLAHSSLLKTPSKSEDLAKSHGEQALELFSSDKKGKNILYIMNPIVSLR